MAICAELKAEWLPARLEQVYQCDRHTIALGLRTLNRRGWLKLSWHPQAARMCIDAPPPRDPDTFTFSQQLRHQLGGLALVQAEAIAPWERALDLQFTKRPGDPPLAHLFVEIMGKYSNVILTTADRTIVTVAHQVNAQQSSVRTVLTGQPYELPPALTDPMPDRQESMQRWQERLSLIPIGIKKNLLKSYRGLSTALVVSMLEAAGIDPETNSHVLSEQDWQNLYDRWIEWLIALEQGHFHPGWRRGGSYSVLGWGTTQSAPSVQTLVSQYYTGQLNQQEFLQLRHQLTQRLNNLLDKLYKKAQDFSDRLQHSDDADRYKEQADLLMTHSHKWQPGAKTMRILDFDTGRRVRIPLDPEKNAVQNAQSLYKKHQKLKRSRLAIEPLLAEVKAEIDYLEQVQVAIAQIDDYSSPEDLQSLEEIRDELVQQGYLSDPEQRYRSAASEGTNFRRYKSPGGFEVWVGRNNRQNDQLTFRLATDYDLWFHSQEIPGSHVLLRLEPGAVPDERDLQFAADVAAYHSRANQSDQVPVIYTRPRNVYKPRGAKPGMAIYKQETVIWGKPQQAVREFQETTA